MIMKNLIVEFSLIFLWLFSFGLTQDLKPFQPCISKSNNSNSTFLDGFSRKSWYSEENYIDALTGFVLYHESSSLTIVSKYEDFENNSHLYTCAVYMRSNQIDNEQYAYINFCGRELSENESNAQFEFSLINSDGQHGRLECRESSEKIYKEKSDFECIRHNETTYSITTLFESNNVEVVFLFKSVNNENTIDNILITPFDLTSSIETSGLCGDVLSNDTSVEASDGGHLIWNINVIDWELNIKENYCHSSNRHKILKTFLGKKISMDNLTTIDTNYLLYSDDSTQVTTKFEKCSDGLANEFCHCGLFIQTLDTFFPRYVFLDACKANRNLNMNFKYYDQTNKTSLKDGIFSQLDCSSSINDENNEDEWNSLKKSFYYFKCARLATSSCETYLIEADVNGKWVRVKVDLKCPSSNENFEYMSNIWISTSKNENRLPNGGLCGRVMYENDDKKCTHYIIEPDGDLECTDDSQKLLHFWNTENPLYNVNWNLDLSSFFHTRSCVLFNYLKSIMKFNDKSIIKDKNAYQISSPVILYDFDQEVMVYSKYRPCQRTFKVQYCTCSLYIRVNKLDPHFAFIDFCSSTVMNPPVLKFQYYKDVERIPYPFLDCNYTITDPDDETEWNAVPISFNYFKCVKFNSYCNTYIIRITNTPYNIRVNADINCDNDDENDELSQIKIDPALKSQDYSLGLCSDWNLNEELNFKNNEINHTTIQQIYEINSLKYYENNDILPKYINQAKSYEIPPADNKTISHTNCRMTTDPHMKGFNLNVYFQFQYPNEYVVYKTDDLMLTVTFKNCGSGVYCNCAAKLITDYNDGIRRKEEILLDVCKTNAVSSLNCNVNSANPKHRIQDFFNNFEWYSTFHNGRSNLKGRVDCYKVKSNSLEETYFMVWFDLHRPSAKSQTLIKLKQTSSNIIIDIEVYPSLKSHVFISEYPDPKVQYNGGICGLTLRPSNTNNVLLWYLSNGVFKSTTPTYYNYRYWVDDQFAKYWSCNNIEFECSKTSKKTNRGIIEQTGVNKNGNLLTKIDYIRENQNLKTHSQFSFEEAMKLCSLKLDKTNIDLNEDLETICKDAIEMCAVDLEETGDEIWLDVHMKILDGEIIKYIRSDINNYDNDNLIRKDVLEKYGIRCPNDCSNNGECIRNTACAFGEECSDLLLCICKDPYGSNDCGVNLKAPPAFTLLDSCYDIRKMNFTQLIGIGSKFSNNNTLYYKLKINSFEHTDEIDEINEDNFKINYPFGSFPEIHKNSATMMVGISYGIDNYYWQNITFFDSNCRTCKDGLLDDTLIEGTCISKLKNTCSKKNIYGSCEDLHPCANGFDLGIIVQGSSKSTEANYEKIKIAISEMIGQYTLRPEQVHVASLFNSQIVRIFSSLKIKDQLNSETTISKINEMPYVPYVPSSLAKALSKTSNEIFSLYRSGTVVPRVAVIFNDAQTNPKENLATEAQKLKNMDVEVFVVGIGNDVDPNELKTMATSSNHIFHYSTHDDMIKNLNMLTLSVCSVNQELTLDKPEYFKLMPNDVRYFKLDLKKVKSNELLVLNEIIEGYAIIYYSFSNKNPQEDDFYSRSLFDEKFELSNNRNVREPNFEFIEIPENAEYMYFTVKTLPRKTQIYLEIKEN